LLDAYINLIPSPDWYILYEFHRPGKSVQCSSDPEMALKLFLKYFTKNEPDVGYYKYIYMEKISLRLMFSEKYPQSVHIQKICGRLTKMFLNFFYFSICSSGSRILRSQFFPGLGSHRHPFWEVCLLYIDVDCGHIAIIWPYGHVCYKAIWQPIWFGVYGTSNTIVAIRWINSSNLSKVIACYILYTDSIPILGNLVALLRYGLRPYCHNIASLPYIP
jgi:hypothetical protein